MASSITYSIIGLLAILLGIFIVFLIAIKKNKKLRSEAPDIIPDKKEVMKDDTDQKENREAGEIRDSIDREFANTRDREIGAGQPETTRTTSSILRTGDSEKNENIPIQPTPNNEREQRDTKKGITLHRPDDL